MVLTVCVLGSGSSGNCIYVASPQTRILIDGGLSGRETKRRLSQVGVDIAVIDAVCVTHEHDDHRSSLGVLQRKHGISLYANAGTIEAMDRSPKLRGLAWNVFSTGATFRIGDLTIEPFSVPHDSYDPVGFVVASEAGRIGIVTDMGMPTTLIRDRLSSCAVVIIEANHDEQMLMDAERPWPLKQRIAGRQGHLSNRQAAELLASIAGPRLKAAFLAHLSRECNQPELALRTVRESLVRNNWDHVAVSLTYPDRISDVVEL
jgi:phosphoribosyl 1,2-cyclic phosphodiesterase